MYYIISGFVIKASPNMSFAFIGFAHVMRRGENNDQEMQKLIQDIEKNLSIRNDFTDGEKDSLDGIVLLLKEYKDEPYSSVLLTAFARDLYRLTKEKSSSLSNDSG